MLAQPAPLWTITAGHQPLAALHETSFFLRDLVSWISRAASCRPKNNSGTVPLQVRKLFLGWSLGPHPVPRINRGFRLDIALGRELVGGVTMKTPGELEAAICEGVSRFEQDYMGRGPKSIHAHLLGDLLVVRLQGVLTAAEQQLVKSLAADKGRDLLKQVRTHLVETARPVLEAMVQEVTGAKVLSLHHDISTVTGEEVVVFTLAESPNCREVKKK